MYSLAYLFLAISAFFKNDKIIPEAADNLGGIFGGFSENSLHRGTGHKMASFRIGRLSQQLWGFLDHNLWRFEKASCDWRMAKWVSARLPSSEK